MKKISHEFVPFDLDASVCDTCGKLIEAHDDPVMMRYREDVWTFLLRKGYIHSYYGSTDDSRMVAVLRHIGVCGIDWTRTIDPKSETVSEFTDTESEPARVVKFVGHLFCKCGQIGYQPICIDDMTLGQIIWHVVNGK